MFRMILGYLPDPIREIAEMVIDNLDRERMVTLHIDPLIAKVWISIVNQDGSYFDSKVWDLKALKEVKKDSG